MSLTRLTKQLIRLVYNLFIKYYIYVTKSVILNELGWSIYFIIYAMVLNERKLEIFITHLFIFTYQFDKTNCALQNVQKSCSKFGKNVYKYMSISSTILALPHYCITANAVILVIIWKRCIGIVTWYITTDIWRMHILAGSFGLCSCIRICLIIFVYIYPCLYMLYHNLKHKV